MCSTFHFGAIVNNQILIFALQFNLKKYEHKNFIGCHDWMPIIYVL